MVESQASTAETRLAEWVRDKIDRYASAADGPQLFAIVDDARTKMDWLKDKRPAIHSQVRDAAADAFARISDQNRKAA